jgi:hypothetical protein
VVSGSLKSKAKKSDALRKVSGLLEEYPLLGLPNGYELFVLLVLKCVCGVPLWFLVLARVPVRLYCRCVDVLFMETWPVFVQFSPKNETLSS